jgi:predicted RNA-binding protein with PIN domain
MPYLIDGDNLLHAARAAFEGAERANRAWLCRLLSSWDSEGRQGITIVFDGYRPATPADGPVAEGELTIRYSDKGTADSRIVEMLNASHSARNLTVVSTDREVRMAARRRRAASVDSTSFIERIRRELDRAERRHRREPPEKYRGLEPGETQRWMEEFGLEVDDESDEDDLWLQ